MSLYEVRPRDIKCPMCGDLLHIVEAEFIECEPDVAWFNIQLESPNCVCFVSLTVSLPKQTTLADIKKHPQWYENVKKA